MTQFYTGLPVEWYDNFFPEQDEQELSFYEHHISTVAGPALEIACGTGRILLPLLERGHRVEGFDASPQMLQRCMQKAETRNIQPVLYKQTMQDLQLPKKYGCLFSPLGSFGQLEHRNDAWQALHHFYRHLEPGGKLIIYVYLPWHNAPAFGQWHQHEPVTSHDTTLVVHEKLIHDPIEQQVYATYRYDLYADNLIVAQQEKHMTICWYSRYEFQMMLQAVGFKNVTVSAGYEDDGPFDTMLFIAQKS